MNEVLHRKMDVTRLHVSQKKEGRNLLSVKNVQKWRNAAYQTTYQKRSTINDDSLVDGFLKDKTKHDMKEKLQINWITGWKEKHLPEQ